MQRTAAAFRPIDRGGVPLDEGRAEEWKTLNVIPVRMSEENVRVNGFLFLGHQLGGQPVDASAAVKNQKFAVGSGQLDARGVAAKVVRARSGGGDRPPRSPETYSHVSCSFRAPSTDRKCNSIVLADPASWNGRARARSAGLARLRILRSNRFDRQCHYTKRAPCRAWCLATPLATKLLRHGGLIR